MVAPDLDPVQSTSPRSARAATRAPSRPISRAPTVRVAQTRDGADSANRTLGVVSPAAEEFRRLGVDGDALARYAAAGQGGRSRSTRRSRDRHADLEPRHQRRRLPDPDLAVAAPAGHDPGADRCWRATRGADPRRLRRRRAAGSPAGRPREADAGGRARARRAARGTGKEPATSRPRGSTEGRGSSDAAAGDERAPTNLAGRSAETAAGAAPGDETLAERLPRRRRGR